MLHFHCGCNYVQISTGYWYIRMYMRTSNLILGYCCIHNSLHLCYIHGQYLLANLSVLSDYAYLHTRERYDGSNEGGFAVASKAVLQQPCQLRISIRNILHTPGYACFLSAPSASSFTTSYWSYDTLKRLRMNGDTLVKPWRLQPGAAHHPEWKYVNQSHAEGLC